MTETGGGRGERIGKYDVLAPLSMGGMAELLLGCTSGPGGFRKYVVIKRILPDASRDEAFVRMFLDEARITAAFSHPNIAQVFDLGEDPEGLYVVMEFIAGQNLNQVTAACARQQAVLPIGFSTAAAHECAQALHYAHTFRTPSGEESPIVHRDVAQKNVMVTYDGQVKLLDFGIAKAKGSLHRTRAGVVKGTAGYMSPEQVRGESLDGRSDVFSLGVVLWEMVTGTRLFSANSEIEEMQLILSRKVQAPHLVESFVPESLSGVVMKALAKNRDERYATARDFARALETECGDILFDTEARAEFMGERFGDRIVQARELFNAADRNTSEAELERIIKNYREGSKDADVQVLRASGQPRSVKPGAAKKRRPKKRQTDENLELVALQSHIEAATATGKGPSSRNWGGLLMMTVLAGVVGLVIYKGVMHEKPKTQYGLTRYPGEPDTEDPAVKSPGGGPPRAIGAIPGRDLPDARPPPSGRGDPVTVSTPPIALPDEPDKPKTAPLRRGKGEITLALLPEATVYNARKQQLAKGSLLTLELSAGTHLLVIVGPDGQERALSVPVKPGKNPPLKMRVADLPLRKQ